MDDELKENVDSKSEGLTIHQSIELEFKQLIADLNLGQYGSVALEVYTNRILQILQPAPKT